MIRVEVTATGIGEVRRNLARAGSMFEDLTPLMREIVGIMLDQVEADFEGEHDPDGRKWIDLKDSTANAIVNGAPRGKHPILQVSGQLAASIGPAVGRDFAQIGTNKVYAAIHQFGGYAGRQHAAKIPARAYIGLGTTALGEIDAAINAYIARNTGG